MEVESDWAVAEGHTQPILLSAVMKLVLAGAIYVPPLMLEAGEPGAETRTDQLTPRQKEILAAIAGGGSNRDIQLHVRALREDREGAHQRDLPYAGRLQPHPGRRGGAGRGHQAAGAPELSAGRDWRSRLVTVARRRAWLKGLCSRG